MNNFALIIGAAKCGTTSLFKYLSQHPQISACSFKEPNFFSISENFDKGFEYYQELWNWNNKIHKVALEATPNYTRVTNENLINSADKIALIQNFHHVNFKFIYILRNPLDRIESHYTHLEAWSGEPGVKPFSEGIEAEIIDTSKYAMQIEEYYKRFSAENILLLNFDELKSDPLNLLKKICDFLDIDNGYNFQGLSTVYNDSKERISLFLPGWKKLRKTELIKTIARNTNPEVRYGFRQIFGQKVNIKIQLSPKQKEFILRELYNDLQKLNSTYGVNVADWRLGLDISSDNHSST